MLTPTVAKVLTRLSCRVNAMPYRASAMRGWAVRLSRVGLHRIKAVLPKAALDDVANIVGPAPEI